MIIFQLEMRPQATIELLAQRVMQILHNLWINIELQAQPNVPIIDTKLKLQVVMDFRA